MEPVRRCPFEWRWGYRYYLNAIAPTTAPLHRIEQKGSIGRVGGTFILRCIFFRLAFVTPTRCMYMWETFYIFSPNGGMKACLSEQEDRRPLQYRKHPPRRKYFHVKSFGFQRLLRDLI